MTPETTGTPNAGSAVAPEVLNGLTGSARNAILGGSSSVLPTLKESRPRTVSLKAHGLGRPTASPLIQNVYRDLTPLTPQKRMWLARQLMVINAIVAFGLATRRNLLIGGSVTIETKDKDAKSFLEDEYFPFTKFNNVVRVMGEHYYQAGNGYLELTRTKDGRIGKLHPLPIPDAVYKNIDPKTGRVIEFVQEVEPFIASNMRLKRSNIRYSNGMPAYIYGIPFSPRQIRHLKNGQDFFPEYGRSLLLSSITDGQILLERERAEALNARYRSVFSNFIQLVGGNDPDIETFKEEHAQIHDFQDEVITGEIKVTPKNPQAGTILSPAALEYFKRKIGIPLLPNYMIWGEDVNRATSREARITWGLSMESDRMEFGTYWHDVLQEVLESYKHNNVVFEVKFGDLDHQLPDEFRENVRNMFLDGVLTAGRYQEAYGEEVDPEIAEDYRWEIEEPDFGGFEDGEETEEPPSF